MFATEWTEAVQKVLARYPAPLRDGPLRPLGNHGGFSGASLWRIGSELCLRASPLEQDSSRIANIHKLMKAARSDGLPFVPAIFAALDGTTAIEYAGRVWELMEWLRGQASYHTSPSRLKLQSACTALGRLHRSWERFTEAQPALIPAVWRRLRETNFRVPEKVAAGPLDPAAAALEQA